MKLTENLTGLCDFAQALDPEATKAELSELQKALASIGQELAIGEIGLYRFITYTHQKAQITLTAYVESGKQPPALTPDSGWTQSELSESEYAYIPFYAVSSDTGEKTLVNLLHFSHKQLPIKQVSLTWFFDFHERIAALTQAWATPVHRAATSLQIEHAQLRRNISELFCTALEQQGMLNTSAQKKELLMRVLHTALIEYYNKLYQEVKLTGKGSLATYAFTETSTANGVLKENHEFVPAMICALLQALTYRQLFDVDWHSIKSALKKLGRAINGAYLSDASGLSLPDIELSQSETDGLWRVNLAPSYLSSLNMKSTASNEKHSDIGGLLAALRENKEHIYLHIPHTMNIFGLCPVLPNPDREPLHIYDAFVDLTERIVEAVRDEIWKLEEEN